jgi:hypothetical protein
MNESAEKSPFSNRVQSAITSVSFPQTLERVRAMGAKWYKAIGKDWVTDMDVLLDFPHGSNVVWIAPKWLTAGDLLFFYHTKAAKNIAKKLYNEAKGLLYSSKINSLSSTEKETKMLLNFLERSIKTADFYSGTIFGFAVVSGRPQRLFDADKHFKGTIYAPLGDVYIFDEPLRSEHFIDIVEIGQNTTTPIYGSQFGQLKERLGITNRLPDVLKEAEATSAGFHDVNSDNWLEISCKKEARFVDEAQLRAYLLDYLLDEIKDTRTPVYPECDCYRNGQRTGIADYFMRLNNKWVPVEAKLNVLVENDLYLQIAKYLHCDAFAPTRGVSRGHMFAFAGSTLCLVMDQMGIYLVGDDGFVDCRADSPIFRREDLNRSTIQEVRRSIITLLK